MRFAWCARRLAVGSFALGLALLTACDRPPSSDGLPEWTAKDHDRTEESAKVAAGQQASARPAENAGDQNRTLVEMTWRNQCATCHGAMGKGDGPNGPMVKATDLTQEEWQAKVADPEIAASIVNGKGKMPKFDLPEKVVTGLVSRIRASRGR